jgi:aerobic-type carbon monoxide dehydrogenase small subunit (CoxS/CutS family)
VTHTLTVNGAACQTDLSPMAPLIQLLREELELRGTKLGCGEGRCGACTVLIDGKPVVSCITPIVNAIGTDIRTIESLAGSDGPLTAVQDAMLECGGVQCGACTPGVVMTLSALLDSGAALTDASVREGLTGNLCRCTGYHKIVDAALHAGLETAK